MEITLLVTLKSDSGLKKYTKTALQDAAVEAVNNALNLVAGNGFDHALNTAVSFEVTDVLPVRRDKKVVVS